MRKGLILLVLFISFRGYTQSCVISAQQFIELIDANVDRTEDILMPCFSEKDGDYRRDYNLKRDGLYDYDIFGFEYTDETSKISFRTTNVSRYVLYKNKLKSYGFKFNENREVYSFGKYTMQTGSVKNASDNTSYWIAVYKAKSK